MGPEDEEQEKLFYGTQHKSGYFSPSLTLHLANFFRSFVGISILTVPYYMSQTGPAIGTGLYILYATLMVINLNMIFTAADAYGFDGRHLGHFVEILHSRTGSLVVSTIISVGNYSGFVATILFFSEFTKLALCVHFNLCYSTNELLLLGFFASAVVITIPNIRAFTFVSFLSSFVLIFVLSTFMIMSFVDTQDTRPLGQKLSYFNPTKTLSFLALISYSIEGIGLAFTLRSAFMEKRTAREFKKYYILCCALVAVLLVTFGVFNYLKFGGETQEFIFFNYQKGHLFMVTLEVVYVTFLFISNPLNIFTVFNHIYETDLILKLEKTSFPGRYLSRYIVRLLVVSSCFLICFMGAHFLTFAQLVGSLLYNFTGLVLPGLVYLKMFESSEHRKIVGPWVAIGIGVTIWVMTTVASIRDIVNQ